jgi:hypothetical protein
MNHKDHIVITTDVRKALDKLKMEMVKQAQVNIHNIFPGIGSKKKPKIKQGKA